MPSKPKFNENNWHNFYRAILKNNMQSQAIWIIDNDSDDQDVVKHVWQELKLPNKLIFLEDAKHALRTLQYEEYSPFIIICELNLPGINGFELRRIMLEKNEKKFHSVPFIFWTTQASEEQIVQAYHLSVHGLFIKDSNFNELKNTFTCIINYWLKSKMPSKKTE
jgi:CheY-like chemotaxis protein